MELEELNMAENTGAVDTSTTATAENATAENTKAEEKQADQNTLTPEAIAKLIQSESDKKTAELGKKNAALEKEIAQLKKEKMSAEELKKYEDEEKAKEMAERERLITDRENRLTAINELTKLELYDASEATSAFLDLVVKGTDEAEIKASVKAIKAFIDKRVADGVDKTFKKYGKNPNGGEKTSTQTDETSIAAKLGKQAADRVESSNKILSHYYGGNK